MARILSDKEINKLIDNDIIIDGDKNQVRPKLSDLLTKDSFSAVKHTF